MRFPAPVAQGEPVATLHDDGYWTPKKTDAGRELNYILSHAGARIDVYTAPLAAPAPVLTPAQSWREAAQWLRNNYQDHPNIASLCDAMTEYGSRQ